MDVRRSGAGTEALKKMLEELQRKEIHAGFFDTSHYPDGTPVAYAAVVQELGHGPIPPRPFMRPAQEENKVKWMNGIAKGLRSVIDGKVTLDHALEQVGMVAAGDIRKAIKAVTSPALKASTIRARQSRKKSKKSASTKPLVDTGLMIQSVASLVVNT